MRYPVARIVSTAVIPLLAGCSSPTEPDVSKIQEALANSQLSLRESVAVGESSVQSGLAIRAGLIPVAEPEFSVRALSGPTLHDIHVSGMSGAVISNTEVGDGSDPCPGSIPLAEAIAIAEDLVNGVGVSVQPDDDDQCYREVQVLSVDTLWEVKLSREGQVLEVEKADGDSD